MESPIKMEEGNEVRSSLEGEDYTITRIVNNTVVLKSKDGKKQIMQGLTPLKYFTRSRKPSYDRHY
jgi:hypothetical protein